MDIIAFDDNHLQINEYHQKSVDEHNEFWQEIVNKYTGYSVDFCYHNREAPVDYMKMINAKLLEDCIEFRLLYHNVSLSLDDSLMVITTLNFDLFSRMHDVMNPDMYWSSEKIRLV